MEHQKSVSLKPRPLFVLSFIISSSLLLCSFFWFYIELPFQAPQAQISFNQPSSTPDLKATQVQNLAASVRNITVTEANLTTGVRSDVGIGVVASSSIKSFDSVEANLSDSLRPDVGFEILDSSSIKNFDSVEASLSSNLHSDVGIQTVESLSNKCLESAGGEDMSQKGENIIEEKRLGTGTVDSLSNKSLEFAAGQAMSRKGEIIEEKSQTMENPECDIYSGRWVLDEEYPLYSTESCPFIDEGFNCDGNGRKDKSYMKWRWRPNDCEIPRFSGADMLELIRGKRIVFVGDSINRNQWESMLCLLLGAAKDRGRVFEARGQRITKGKGNYKFKFLDYHCSVEYYLSHFLVHEGKSILGQKRLQTLRIDTIDKSSSKWKGADILVFNSAHWWSHSKTKSGKNYYQEGDQVHRHLDALIAFRKALMTWGSWVDLHAIPGKTQVFFRSSAPSHFRGGQWNTGGRCDLEKEPIQNTTSITDNIDESRLTIAEEENIFEWQFAIRGPCDSEFEGGIYHGRIQLPADYPFQPPAFMMLTPNGRFETQTKICLSISNHHPEQWQPSWSVRTALVALIAFMPTKADGALGSLEYTKEERRALAIKSRGTPPKFGNAERQKLIDEIHEYMLSKVPPGPPLCPKHEKHEEQANATEEATNAAVATPATEQPNAEVPRVAEGHSTVENVRQIHMNANAGPLRVSFSAGLRVSRRVPEATETSEQQQRPEVRARNHVDDRWLTWLAIGLAIAIVVLILKKYMKSTGLVHQGDEL